jgi:phospholipase D1/2
MNAMHPNIHAIRHPNFTPITWSHHQKFGALSPFPLPTHLDGTLIVVALSNATVVVDEEVAFVGGVDLCYNRYDDSRYLLADHDSSVFPGRCEAPAHRFSRTSAL